MPLSDFPRLKDATPSQRKKWRLIADGVGLRWEELDEDISVSGLLFAQDPIWRIAGKCHSKDTDLSYNHDKYLYGWTKNHPGR